MSAAGDTLRLRVEQFDTVLGDVDANFATVAAASQAAAMDGVDLLVTPELSLTGYDLRDRVHELAMPLADSRLGSFGSKPGVILGLVELGDDLVPYNAAVHLEGGSVVHRHRKVYLPTYGMFDEGRFFGRGDSVRLYRARGWAFGLLVCEDLWHPALAYLLAMQGAEVIVVQAAAAGRGLREGGGRGRFASAEGWEQLARAVAVAYGVYVVLANRSGVEGGCVFAGGSLIIAPGGRVLARGSDTGADRPTAELARSALAAARRGWTHSRDEDPHLVLRELRRVTDAPA